MSSKRARVGVVAAAAFLALGAASAATTDDRVVVNPQSAYPEGPVVDGNFVYYAEMGSDRVMRWDGHANVAIWSRSGCGPTSVARGGGDMLVILCDEEQVLVRITTAGKTVEVIGRDSEGHPFLTPNASINDAKGGIYWTSSGLFSPTSPSQGAVLYLDKSGGLHRLAEASTIPTASGFRRMAGFSTCRSICRGVCWPMTLPPTRRCRTRASL